MTLVDFGTVSERTYIITFPAQSSLLPNVFFIFITKASSVVQSSAVQAERGTFTALGKTQCKSQKNKRIHSSSALTHAKCV